MRCFQKIIVVPHFRVGCFGTFRQRKTSPIFQYFKNYSFILVVISGFLTFFKQFSYLLFAMTNLGLLYDIKMSYFRWGALEPKDASEMQVLFLSISLYHLIFCHFFQTHLIFCKLSIFFSCKDDFGYV